MSYNNEVFKFKKFFCSMELPEEVKTKMYFDVLLAEKTRLENEIRLRKNFKQIYVGLGLTALATFISLITAFTTYIYHILPIGIVIEALLIVGYHLNWRELKKIIILHNRYFQEFDSMAKPDYPFSKLNEKYSELRELERKLVLGWRYKIYKILEENQMIQK